MYDSKIAARMGIVTMLMVKEPDMTKLVEKAKVVEGYVLDGIALPDVAASPFASTFGALASMVSAPTAGGNA